MDAAEFEMMCEADAKYGDPRRCLEHGVPISSPDGLFDGECPKCEQEINAQCEAEFLREQEEHYIEEEGRTGWPEDEDDSPF